MRCAAASVYYPFAAAAVRIEGGGFQSVGGEKERKRERLGALKRGGRCRADGDC